MNEITVTNEVQRAIPEEEYRQLKQLEGEHYAEIEQRKADCCFEGRNLDASMHMNKIIADSVRDSQCRDNKGCFRIIVFFIIWFIIVILCFMMGGEV